MNKLVRIMLGIALGICIFARLARYISHNPVAIAIWMIVTIFLGIVVVRPREYIVEWRKSWREHVERRIERQKRQILEDLPFVELYRLDRINADWRILWIVSGCAWLWIFGVSVTGRADIMAWLCAFIGSPLMVCTLLGQILKTYYPSDVKKVPKLLRKRRRQIRNSKKSALLTLFLPFSILWVTFRLLYHLVVLPLIRFGDTLFALGLLLAKTCKVVSGLEGWIIAIGTLTGEVAWLTMGKDDLVGITFGTLTGGAIWLVSWLLPKVLPNPQSEWPKVFSA